MIWPNFNTKTKKPICKDLCSVLCSTSKKIAKAKKPPAVRHTNAETKFFMSKLI